MKVKKFNYSKFKSNFKKKLKKVNYTSIVLKVLLIGIVIFGLYFTNLNYSNNISLLAVNEGSNGEIRGGSIINLNLDLKRGTGNIYINLNTIEDLDTQISIINSQKIACDIFELNCQNFDFYYTFNGDALVLKGPSASSAIAILVAKTMQFEKLNKDTVITGALNSGGIIGNVGGVNEKIKIAESKGFKRVIIPTFSEYSIPNTSIIDVKKSLDIVDAYNLFTKDDFEITTYPINNSKYQNLMKKLANQMCDRSLELKDEINYSSINENSSLNVFKLQSIKSFNSSKIAMNNSNYYSAGSFCYNSNINNRLIIEKSGNISSVEFKNKLNKLENIVNLKLINISSEEYKNKIITINDFYVYLLLNNRIYEAREYFEEINKLDKKLGDFIKEQDSKTIINDNSSLVLINSTLKEEFEENILNQKKQLYSFAYERFYTVGLWENFVENYGTKINFDDKKIESVCKNINREILIKSEIMKKYNIHYLDEEVNKQSQYNIEFTNQYLCIYNGLELNGKINTILNSVGITNEDNQKFGIDLQEFTKSRLSLNSRGEFPLLPYIYSEYSEDLLKQNDSAAAMLYSNYALSYLDLNLFLEEDMIDENLFIKTFTLSFKDLLFVGALLVIIGFI